ncbi:hypothetical protein A2631_05845 [Candidatus Daviesbacteria bacterium RIFCSPHIGHO2_01_FULL_44_29]|uniref:Uncharacterized protein n=1 Tax=Candidatus Daviesbacteria bacterium RIFCSPHIGHO2_02_FULL_43_12 TaxID=1797776 RepID=A0A1F5KK27_9BACT|nr:MAG: hypothetical protein A2631_05845 [Candidatus Daviesbacteria bacterium RIFCSPHIGHO2_01_FULL_44_29]OGE39466.1 MAG: hypothetical protein A3E86_03915 [Candidatus Daviesbacteria bacterium RIFCSPHIGHO2_12_FULL_47_45]OGE40971.1 MAG: hypothetical protein A3D25_02950 [Candidatus Daviesbacteria bacterium RIFCSPHIGHO2_02_FULL_43_12]OGE69878.1 MAG: hypothetical protein A3B55_05720 [Candidatus Daviesbacteria bacterium RIFCSPLOWO2_01_FULL_43_15]
MAKDEGFRSIANDQRGRAALLLEGLLPAGGFRDRLAKGAADAGRQVIIPEKDPRSPQELKDLTPRLLQYLKDHKVRSLVLVGTSLGGAAALYFIYRLREEGKVHTVEGLNTIVSPFGLDDLSRRVKLMRGVGQAVRRLAPQQGEAFLKRVFPKLEILTNAEAILQMLEAERRKQITGTPVLAVTTRVSDLKHPFIHSDWIIHHGDAIKSLRARFKNVEDFTVAPEPVIGPRGINLVAGHYLNHDESARVSRRIDAFLRNPRIKTK